MENINVHRYHLDNGHRSHTHGYNPDTDLGYTEANGQDNASNYSDGVGKGAGRNNADEMGITVTDAMCRCAADVDVEQDFEASRPDVDAGRFARTRPTTTKV